MFITSSMLSGNESKLQAQGSFVISLEETKVNLYYLRKLKNFLIKKVANFGRSPKNIFS